LLPLLLERFEVDLEVVPPAAGAEAEVVVGGLVKVLELEDVVGVGAEQAVVLPFRNVDKHLEAGIDLDLVNPSLLVLVHLKHFLFGGEEEVDWSPVDVDGDPDVDVHELWQDGEVDGLSRLQRMRVPVAFRLRHRIQAVVVVHRHLAVALVPVPRVPDVILHAFAALLSCCCSASQRRCCSRPPSLPRVDPGSLLSRRRRGVARDSLER